MIIPCKKHIIAAGFSLILPFIAYSEAPVVDDSENFAMVDGQQVAKAPVSPSKYEEPQIENSQVYGSQDDYYSRHNSQSDEGPALVQEDRNSEIGNDINDSAKLIDKIQTLQQEIQELRGQLEVQAHDLKLLQQQQIAFYKDLDARIGNGGVKTAQAKDPVNKDLVPKASIASSENHPAGALPAQTIKPNKTVPAPLQIPSGFKTNPADEQISYMAAYELVKNKRYDNAIHAMQTFIGKYPRGGYTANAEYWLGELFLFKKDYSKAIEHFEIVLNQFPSSSKSAASMLKVGYAYAATGQSQEAIKRLQQVIHTYPGTSSAQLANLKLKSIKAL